MPPLAGWAALALLVVCVALWWFLRAMRVRLALRGSDWQLPADELVHPFPHEHDPGAAIRDAFAQALVYNRSPRQQVVVGIDRRGRPAYLDDRTRSGHVLILGDAGTGKTQSVLFQLLYQDASRPCDVADAGHARGRPLVFLTGDGRPEHRATLASIAAATGQLSSLRILDLTARASTHTYNPLHVGRRGDPVEVAARAFPALGLGTGVQSCEPLTYELWLNLVRALVSTGKQFTMLDVAAALSDDAIMSCALALAEDHRAVHSIQRFYRALPNSDEHSSSHACLLSAVGRFDHPALNAYNPDIILDTVVERGGIVGVSFWHHAHAFQAHAVGIVMLQHLQQLGMAHDSKLPPSAAPICVYADDLARSFIASACATADRLRESNVSLCVSAQSLFDFTEAEHAHLWRSMHTKVLLAQHAFRTDGGYPGVPGSVRLDHLGRGEAYLLQRDDGDGLCVARLHLAALETLPASAPPPPAIPSDLNGLRLHARLESRRAAATEAG